MSKKNCNKNKGDKAKLNKINKAVAPYLIGGVFISGLMGASTPTVIFAENMHTEASSAQNSVATPKTEQDLVRAATSSSEPTESLATSSGDSGSGSQAGEGVQPQKSKELQAFEKQYGELFKKTEDNVSVSDKEKINEAIQEHYKLSETDKKNLDIEPLTRLYNRVLKLESELQDKQSELETKQQELKKVEAEISKKTTDVEKLKEELKKVKDLENAASELLLKINKALKLNEELEELSDKGDSKEMNEKRAMIIKQLVSFGGSVETLKQQMDELQKEKSSYEPSKTIEEKIEKVDTELKEEKNKKARFDKEIEQLENKIGELKANQGQNSGGSVSPSAPTENSNTGSDKSESGKSPAKPENSDTVAPGQSPSTPGNSGADSEKGKKDMVKPGAGTIPNNKQDGDANLLDNTAKIAEFKKLHETVLGLKFNTVKASHKKQIQEAINDLEKNYRFKELAEVEKQLKGLYEISREIEELDNNKEKSSAYYEKHRAVLDKDENALSLEDKELLKQAKEEFEKLPITVQSLMPEIKERIEKFENKIKELTKKNNHSGKVSTQGQTPNNDGNSGIKNPKQKEAPKILQEQTPKYDSNGRGILKNTIPQTGDASSVAQYAFTMLLSAAAGAMALFRKKTEK